MAVNIVIAGTTIAFPSTSASPNWAPAVVMFAQVVAEALSSVVGSFDVVPQQFILDSVPNGADTAITNLSFSTTEVRSALINYAIYRNTDSVTVSESGILQIVYNEDESVGQKWQMLRESDSDAQVEFVIDDTGQVFINTEVLAGSDYNGFISYSAKALQNSY
jgi:hypothetical protein